MWYKQKLNEEFRRISGLQDGFEVTLHEQQHWEIVTKHLKELFGNRASPEFCLESYHENAEIQKCEHDVCSCNSIVEITLNEILDMITQDEEYSKAIRKALELLHRIEKYTTQKDVIELATIIGVIPNKEGLYQWLVIDSANLSMNNENALNLLTVVCKMIACTLRPGNVVEYPGVGHVMTQQRCRSYYRGENAVYGSSKPSRYRSHPKYPANYDDLIYRMRLYQCCEMLDKFDAVSRWGNSNVNYLALAQHYGVHTAMLDFTSDLKTALFFACCKYENGKWEPLKRNDFESKRSRPKVSRIGGDSRYGVIYSCLSEIADLERRMQVNDPKAELFVPVGHQPFMRCSSQYGYMLLTHDAKYDLMRDKRFEKFKFRLDEAFCRSIYEDMDRGRRAFPNDDVPDISSEMHNMNNRSVISESVLKMILEDTGGTKSDVPAALKKLQGYGISISKDVDCISPQRLREINEVYNVDVAMNKAPLHRPNPLVTLW